MVRPGYGRAPTVHGTGRCEITGPSAGAAMPPELQRWVAAQCGGTGQVTDVSWPRATSRVWRVRRGDTSTAVYVKIAPTARHFQREIHTYRRALAGLRPGGAPRLLADEPRLHALMISAVSGTLVHHLPPAGAHARVIHRAAGRLLRRLHDAALHVPQARRQADAVAHRAVARSAVHLERVGHLLTHEQRELVHRSRQIVGDLAGRLPVAWRHGDFRPRNWLWQAGGESLGVIDFERSEVGIAVADLAVLAAGPWAVRPGLREVFLDGYGRPLTGEEARALPAFTALAALDDLQWAEACGTAHEAAQAHGALARLVDAHRRAGPTARHPHARRRPT